MGYNDSVDKKLQFIGALGCDHARGFWGRSPRNLHRWPAVSGAAAATRKQINIQSYLLRPTNAAKAAFVRGAACGKTPRRAPVGARKLL